jgi:hypothetical protein
MNSQILKQQSRACREYMKFLDRQIADARRKSRNLVVEKVSGTTTVITYFKNK